MAVLLSFFAYKPVVTQPAEASLEFLLGWYGVVDAIGHSDNILERARGFVQREKYPSIYLRIIHIYIAQQVISRFPTILPNRVCLR